MRLVIVTGISGAGKVTALKIFEDNGYYCVDNLPIDLIESFADILFGQTNEKNKVAIGVDIRSGKNLEKMSEVLKNMKAKEQNYEILFLDCNNNTLIKRFKETRRSHPMGDRDSVENEINEERAKLEFLREQADYIIDTSNLLVKELRGEIEKIFVLNRDYRNLFVTIMSFGFKHGVPADCDLVFDVRFLPNPYYIEELREQTGDDAPVYDYVMSFDQTKEFIRHLKSFLDYVFIQYKNEKKNHLTVGIGCTGGHHRSVSVTNWLYSHYRDQYHCYKSHRDKKVG